MQCGVLNDSLEQRKTVVGNTGSNLRIKCGVYLIVMLYVSFDKYIMVLLGVPKRGGWVKGAQVLSVSSLWFFYKYEVTPKFKVYLKQKRKEMGSMEDGSLSSSRVTLLQVTLLSSNSWEKISIRSLHYIVPISWQVLIRNEIPLYIKMI